MRKLMRFLRWIAIDIFFIAIGIMSVGAAMIIGELIGCSNMSAEIGRQLIAWSLLFALPIAVLLLMAKNFQRKKGNCYYYYIKPSAAESEEKNTDSEDSENLEKDIDDESEEDTSEDEAAEKKQLDLKEVDIDENKPFNSDD